MSFTITNEPRQVKPGVFYIEAACDENDTKPTTFGSGGIANGSKCIESDTGDTYFFSDTTSAWVKQFSFKQEG